MRRIALNCVAIIASYNSNCYISNMIFCYMDIQERLNIVISTSGLTPTALEKMTGIDRMRWSNVKRRSVRAGAQEIEAAGKLWPQYAYWLVTGLTQPEAGHISPKKEEQCQS
jgi:hypothetical protein